ncbi:unnamed protein product [Brachionus calyciflorus]|uniref:Peptide-methionine (R)-S-oxide reductase n=1 Tax=Brachionus calyciflorus TaxID=104777 RepID=A0A813S196_9BILA|nr:unnamed protein product [Brachionus calyciflorus]
MSQHDDEKWKKVLTPEQFYVTRQKGTERPYTSEYLNFDKDGKYTCICCGAELFTSDAKFNSHCGWPAFYKASNNEQNIERTLDKSHGMIRTEVTCKQCGAHLGHVFDDGPRPTGERFCINGVSIKFSPK